MKTPVANLEHPVRVIEHQWIPMRDGTRLSARLWLPAGPETRPAPAILEVIPYRKRDLKRPRDSRIHHYFAGHGYPSIRVDLRGSGDSEGLLADEYLPREQDDGEDILAWLAAQRWCDGTVGMMGISWGGFAALQLAMRRPPQLRAVIAVAATDDRYADDVHYKGGCLLNDNLSWASVMSAFNAMPPDPEVVGDRWRSLWRERLEGSDLWVRQWLEHPHRDAYWAHGSVCEDYAAIEAPVMAVSGWADGYPNPVFRLVANLHAPCKGLIGPWSHAYPHLSLPGPRIGFLQEALRWWDHWLAGRETGVMDEPRLRVWMQESARPRSHYAERPGRWVAEPTWPTTGIHETPLQLSGHGLHWPGEPIPVDAGRVRSVQSPLSVGLFGGKWCSYSNGPDLPYDQREEDGGALTFDTTPLAERLEILGAPVAELVVEADRPVAQLALRLSDRAPDGKTTRVTYGLLNLCHRDGSAAPRPLTPGRQERVRIALDHIAQAFPAGHRLRLAVSTSYWPLAWVPPEPARVTLHPAGSRLWLPVRQPRAQDEELRPFEAVEAAPPTPTTELAEGTGNWLITRDLARDESTLHVIEHQGRHRLEEIDLEVERSHEEFYRFRGDDFTSVSGEIVHRRELHREDWDMAIETRTRMWCDREFFYLHATQDAYDQGRRFHARNWEEKLPRRLL